MYRTTKNNSKRGVTYRFMESGALLLFAVWIPVAAADSISDATAALRKGDTASAISTLEKAAADGDTEAKGQLASYLRTLGPPYRDVARACLLAREAADSGSTIGAVTRAECLITGAEKADQPFPLAREQARAALKKGAPAAGFTLYQTFMLDPRYQYAPGGKTDITKYAALAGMPVSARGEQIEALNGLAFALRGGHVTSMFMTLGYLADTSAPGNNDRMVNLAALMQKSGEKIPQQLQGLINTAQQIRSLGKTNTSLTAFQNAFKTAFLTAGIQMRGVSKEESGCDLKQIKLTQITADPISNPEYLPLEAPLANSYLVRGEWNESWTFSGCDKNAVIPMNFVADGWGGARFSSTASPR